MGTIVPVATDNVRKVECVPHQLWIVRGGRDRYLLVRGTLSTMSDDALLTSLLAAVDAAPDDVPLRLHVAEQLAARGRPAEALAHCSAALQRAPGDPAALALLSG